MRAAGPRRFARAGPPVWHACSRGDSEGGTTAEPGDRPAQHQTVPHRAVDPAEGGRLRGRARPPTPSTGCSSGTSRNCGRWASRCRPTTGRLPDPAGRVLPARAELHPGRDRGARPGRSAVVDHHAGIAPAPAPSARSRDAAEPGNKRPRRRRRRCGPNRRQLLQPRVRTGDPAFRPLWSAVQARRAVRFAYRKERRRGTPTPDTCTRGGWCSSTAGGTSSGSTWTAATDARSDSPGSSARWR